MSHALAHAPESGPDAARKLVSLRGFDPSGWRTDALLLLREISQRHHWAWSKVMTDVNLILSEEATSEQVFTRLTAEEIAA